MIESLGIIPYSQKAYNKKNSTENKKEYTDIICTSYTPYFPSYFLGTLKEIYVDKLDYMVGMKDFETLFAELNINNKYIPRNNKIYNVISRDVLNNIKVLTNKEIKIISDYTNRIESSLYTKIGFDFYVLHHLQQYHIQDILNDIESGVLHKFIELNYSKTNLKVHLFPHKCMKEKNLSYEDVLSYCISVMWATLISIVATKDKVKNILELLKEVFYFLNPILTKMVFCSHRKLTPTGYSFVQELSQLTSVDKFIDIKTPCNRVVIRWSPRSDRFENYIYKCFRHEVYDYDDEAPKDVRGDSNGKRCLIYDCQINKDELITQITVVGQNIMRDLTGYYTSPIYGLLADVDILENYELSSLFRILTGTKEHNNIFKRELFKAYEDVISGKVKFIFDGDFGTSEADQDLTDGINNDETVSISDNKTPKNKRCKYLKTLADAYSSGKKKYAANMVSLAIERLRRKVFLDIEHNNDLYVATQLIAKFNLKRNVPKDIITVLKMADLPEEELSNKLNLVERHKRDKIKDMIEFVKALEPTKPILNELYNYLWSERYV